MADKPARPARGSRRMLKLAGMTASLAGRYAGNKLASAVRSEEQRKAARARLNQQAGDHLADTLGELKGAVMKLGQFASQVSDLLPEDIANALTRLQQQAPPMDFELIREQLESGLGAPLDELFAALDQQPHAAASIGQVHRGRLHDGREVVVKVQYPGIAASCDADLRQLKRALRMGRLVQVDKNVLDAMFSEIRERLHEELDYCKEADNLREFQHYFADEARLRLPQLIASHCSREVLTMEYLPGTPLREAPKDQRATLGRTLVDVMCRSLFEHHAIHADPNPGNFAVDADGHLLIYDFGCVKHLPKETVETYRTLITAALACDWATVDSALGALGARVPGSAPLPDDFYAGWRPIVLKPLLAENGFDFAQSRIHKAVMAKSPEVLKLTRQLQPPSQTVFVDRMINGHYWTLVNLGAVVDLRAAIAPWIGLQDQ